MLSVLDLTRPLPDLLVRAEADLHTRMLALRGHGLLSEATVSLDADTGGLVWEWPGPRYCGAGAQLIGIGMQEPDRAEGVYLFRFAWDDPGVPANLGQAAAKLKELAARPGFEELGQSGDIRMHRQRIWAICGLAAALTDASGACAVSLGEGRQAFVTFAQFMSLRPQ